jgi:succinoglycan biosynthesis transport protein ExoP
VELKEYFGPLVKWWWLLLAAQLVAAAASFVATRGQPPIYQTSTTLMVGSALDNPNPTGAELGLAQQLVQTYAETARSSPLRKAAMTALGLSRLPSYVVRVLPNTLMLEISVTDTDPQRAQAVANELAHQLILRSPATTDQEQQQRQAFVNQQLDELEASITETRAEIDRYRKELEKMTSARQIADTQAQIAALESKLRTLQANYAAMLANTRRGAINVLSIVEPAALPVRPVGPNRVTPIALAAAIGLALAVGGAYLLEYLDDTVKRPEDAQRALGVNILGAIPPQEKAAASNVMGVSSHSEAAEAYRVLRTNLAFAVADRPVHRLLITSPAPSEGKSLIAANLGAALAQIGRTVILVDADLRRPQQHRLFSLGNSVGLTGALSSDNPDLDKVLQKTHVPGLFVLTSGPPVLNPGNWLESARMHKLLEGLSQRADIVVVDTPPVTVLADALVLAPQCDGVLLVLESARTRRQVAQKALEALAQVNGRVIGAILNRVPRESVNY